MKKVIMIVMLVICFTVSARADFISMRAKEVKEFKALEKRNNEYENAQSNIVKRMHEIRGAIKILDQLENERMDKEKAELPPIESPIKKETEEVKEVTNE